MAPGESPVARILKPTAAAAAPPLFFLPVESGSSALPHSVNIRYGDYVVNLLRETPHFMINNQHEKVPN